jgi:3-phosphoshikimate 1-carboxyvinyltransferase
MERGLEVEFTEPPTSQAYLELTIEELRRWGVAVQAQRRADGSLASVRVPAGPPAARAQVPIEADASSALYWAVAAAIVPGSRLELAGLPGGSSQPDMGALRALAAMGARVEFAPDAVRVEWCQQRHGAPLHGAELDAAGFPDGALALAAAAAVAGGATTLRGLGTLRVKESDRLAAMEAELGRVGCEARVEGEALVVDPPALLAPRGACVRTYRDHRIAMSFAVLALRTGGIQVADPGCVGKSYPGFWRDLERLRSRIG